MPVSRSPFQHTPNRQQRDHQLRQMPLAGNYRTDMRAVIGWGIMGVIIVVIVLFS